MKKLKVIFCFDAGDARVLSKLLGNYQDELESVIESHLIPGENKARGTFDRSVVAKARKNWRNVENFQMRLSKELSGSRRGGAGPFAGRKDQKRPLLAGAA